VIYEKYADGTAKYNVNFGIHITNISDEEIEISYEILEYFLGEYLAEEDTKPIEPINIPTLRPQKELSSQIMMGQSSGKKIGSLAFAYGPAKYEITKLLDDVVFSNNGMVTSVLGPGETSFGNRDFIVRGKPGQYVVFGSTVGIESSYSWP